MVVDFGCHRPGFKSLGESFKHIYTKIIIE